MISLPVGMYLLNIFPWEWIDNKYIPRSKQYFTVFADEMKYNGTLNRSYFQESTMDKQDYETYDTIDPENSDSPVKKVLTKSLSFSPRNQQIFLDCS